MDNTFNPELIQQIAALVLERIEQERGAIRQINAPSRNLVLFSGSTPGFAEALDSLARLRQEGYTFRVMLTESAKHILDTDAIAEKLQPEEVLDSTGFKPGKLAAATDLLILPTATVNMAAKLCAFMTDTMPLAYILRVLMLRRRVVLAVNGCCPTRMERLLHTQMPPAIKEGMSANLTRLEEFGAELCDARRIYETVTRTATIAEPPRQIPAAAQLPNKVISQEDVMGLQRNAAVRIRQDALVTSLAAEAAERYGIRFIRA